MSEREPLRNLWEGLARESEVGERELTVVLPRAPLTRRQRSLKERLVGAYLSGFLPAYLALGLGASSAVCGISMEAPQVMAVWPGLLAAGWVTMVPAAWLIASLWSARVTTAWRYLLLGVAASGLGHLAMIVPFLCLQVLSRGGAGQDWSLAMAQALYQNFLTFGSVLAALLGSLALALGLRRSRHSTPWLEAAQRSWRRQLVSALALAFPLLLLMGFAGMHQTSLRDADASFRRLLQGGAYDQAHRKEWQKMVETLQASDPTFELFLSERNSWSLPTLRLAEREIRRLHSLDPKSGDWTRHRVTMHLLKRAEALQQPELVAWQSVEFSLATRYSWGRTNLVDSAFEQVIFPRLSAAPLDKTQLQVEAEMIDQLVAMTTDPRDRFPSALYDYARMYLHGQRSEPFPPLRAFGTELPFSLPGVVIEWRAARLVAAWEELAPQLDWSSQRRLEGSLLQHLGSVRSVETDDGDLLELCLRPTVASFQALRTRPLLNMASAMVLLRQYKLDHGRPEHLDPARAARAVL